MRASHYETQIHQPCNFLILPLPRLNLQGLLIHLMHIIRSLHVAQDVVLEIADAFERVWDALILLDVANDFRSLGAFRKIDESGAFYNAGNTVFDEGQIGQIDAWRDTLILRTEWHRHGSGYRKRECRVDWLNEASLGIQQSSCCYSSTCACSRAHFGCVH